MFQGTGSDVGKSTIVAGLGRAFARRGLRVRPFKPQNMSNNAAVTADGGEIGRAQALQARACGAEPLVDMNPILLKPEDERGAQLIVHGQMRGHVSAAGYQECKAALMPAVLASFYRLAAEADLILVEGAGSASEVNLRAGDIANMGFAEAADLPVVLIGDIERGGVIAQLVGTHVLLSDPERARLAGYVVNRFRGDPRLFDGGVKAIGARTGLDCLGVVPWCAAADRLPAEDSLGLPRHPAADGPIRIAVPILPRIANFDDLDPLRAEPDVALVPVPIGEALPGNADLVVLPGSKATIADLAALRETGWHVDLAAHRRRGGAILGLCGGYQMLGHSIDDPEGIEGGAGWTPGLGFLQLATCLGPAKRLQRTRGRHLPTGAAVEGYEIHLGETTGPDTARPLLDLGGRADGAISADGKVMGCYLHGLFASDDFRHAFLDGLRHRAASGLNFERSIDAALDALADHLEAHIDTDRVLAAAGWHR